MATKAIAKPRRRRKQKMTIPLGIVAPVGIVTAKSVAYGFEHEGRISVQLERTADMATMAMTGYSPLSGDFDYRRMQWGAFPMLVGLVAHKVAQKFGLNRSLANAGIPLIRI